MVVPEGTLPLTRLELPLRLSQLPHLCEPMSRLSQVSISSGHWAILRYGRNPDVSLRLTPRTYLAIHSLGRHPSFRILSCLLALRLPISSFSQLPFVISYEEDLYPYGLSQAMGPVSLLGRDA